MRRLALVAAVLGSTVAVVLPSSYSAADSPTTTATTTVSTTPAPPPPKRNNCEHLYSRHYFRFYARMVYHSNHKLNKHRRTKVSLLVHCQKTLKAEHWAHKTRRLLARAQAHRIFLLTCSNYNPLPCIAIAARRWHVSYQWLVNCANSEGGTGPSDYDKMNYQHSGAGGNFQFMPGTFFGNIRAAGWRGKAIWLNSRQQALTAAYMFHIGQSGQWTGKGC